MPLPISGPLKVQDIETEFGIGTAVTVLVSATLGPYISKTPDTLIKFSDFYGASAIAAPTARSANPTLNRIVAVSNTTTQVASSYSDDGSTWTASATPPAIGTWRSVACSPIGRFVAVSSGSADSAYSDDGNTWTTAASLPSSQLWFAVACSRLTGRFVAIVYNSTVSAYSDNGTTWNASPGGLPSASLWNSIACSPTTGRFVALGQSALAYSDDGSTWVAGTSPTTSIPRAIACNFTGRFMASWSTDSFARYSDNGTSWVSGPSYPSSTDSYTVACDPITGDYMIAGTTPSPIQYATLSQGGIQVTNPLTLTNANSYRAAVAGGSATGNVFVHLYGGTSYRYVVGASTQTTGTTGLTSINAGATASPPAFTASFVSYVTTNSIIFIFNLVSGATSYDISGTGITTTNGVGPSIAVIGLSPNTSYGPFSITSKNGSTTGQSVAVSSIYTRPSAPTNLVFSSFTQTGFTVSWTAPSGAGALTYTVVRSLGTVVASGISGTSFSVTGLTAGTLYVVMVYATGPGGRSAGLSTVYPTRPRTAPAAVTSFTASSPTFNSITLSWVNPPSLSYTAFDITYTDGTPQLVTTTTSPITISGLLSTNTLYTFTNTSRYYSNNGGQATTSGYTAPAAPTSFTGTVVGATTINFTWVAPAGTISSYTLSGTGVPGSPITITAPATSYNLTGLTTATAYTFSLTATNSTSGLTSAAVSAGPYTTFGVPVAPTSFSGTVVSTSQINFSWVAPTGTGTILSYTLSGTGVPGSPITITAPATSYNLTGLSGNTTYPTSGTFSLTATNDGGTGAAATAGPYTTIPGAPTSFTGAVASATRINFTWVAPTGTGTILSYTLSGTGVPGSPITITAPATSYNLTGLSGNTTYPTSGTFSLTATNGGGTGAAATAGPYTTLTPGNVSWVARAGSTLAGDIAYTVSVDSGGNVYIAGLYGATSMTFYNSDTTQFATTLAQIGGQDAFFAKYNTSGAVQWVARAGSAGQDVGYCSAVDSSGNLYVAGQYAGTMTFYNSSATGSGAFATTLAQIGGTDLFVVKYDTSGAVQWVARAGSAGTDVARGIAVDSGGNVYMTGYYTGTMTIYNSSAAGSGAFATTLAQIGGTDVCTVKYNTSGAVQWVARSGSAGTDFGFAIAVDSGSNVYVTGQYTGTMTFYNSSAAGSGAFATTLAQIGGIDVCTVKYNTSGAVQWVARSGSTLGTDIGNAIAVDSGGNVYVTGQYAGTPMTFYNSSAAGSGAFATTLAQIGGIDVFIVKYNTSGAVQWVAQAGSAGTDIGNTIAVDSSGNLYVAGQYTGTMTFYNSSATGSGAFATTLAQIGGADVYTAKYDTSGAVQWVARSGSAGTDTRYGITVDALGYVYMTGYYAGTMTIYNSGGTAFATTLAQLGGNDVYVAKYVA